MSESAPISINVERVLDERLGRRARRIPRFLVRGLERLIHQEDMNKLLKKAFPRRGADFCKTVLEELDVELEVKGRENLPEDSRRIFVCNHPLGGLDGIAMIDWLSRQYKRPVHFVVNDLLSAVEPLKECFVPVNKHGKQSREAIKALEEAFSGDDPVIMFPAGLVSRKHADGSIADLKWNKMFVQKAKEYGRDIVPLYFEGTNTPTFYRFARLRTRLGMKFNLEMILLPREVFKARGSRFTLYCGTALPSSELVSGAGAGDTASAIRNIVYSLPSQYKKL